MSDKEKMPVAILMDNVKGLKIIGGHIRGFDQGVVVTNSQDAEIRDLKITSREALHAWSELQHAVANLHTSQNEKENLLQQVADLRATLGKPNLREKYDRLVASAANHAGILPLLNKFWEFAKNWI